MTEGLVRAGTLELAYDVQGTGAPLLLVAGFGLSRVMWEPDVCQRLCELGFRVVRMDNRDTGRSSRLESMTEPDLRMEMVRSTFGLRIVPPYTLEDMAEDCMRVMRHLGHPRFHVVGASMGGMIAQTLAIENRDSVLSLASIMSSPGGRGYAVADPRALITLLTPMPTDPAGQLAQCMTLFRVMNGNELPFEEARARKVVEAHVATRPLHGGAVRQFAAILDSDGRRRARVPEIRTPTLVLHGTNDPVMPFRAGKATARLIPGATFEPLQGMGHLFHTTRNEQMLRSIARNAGL